MSNSSQVLHSFVYSQTDIHKHYMGSHGFPLHCIEKLLRLHLVVNHTNNKKHGLVSYEITPYSDLYKTHHLKPNNQFIKNYELYTRHSVITKL